MTVLFMMGRILQISPGKHSFFFPTITLQLAILFRSVNQIIGDHPQFMSVYSLQPGNINFNGTSHVPINVH